MKNNQLSHTISSGGIKMINSPKTLFQRKTFNQVVQFTISFSQKKHRIILNNRKLCGKITKFMIFPQSFVKNIVETHHGTSLQTAY